MKNINERKMEMKKEKWTCWIDEGKKAEGAVVGTRKAVLDWMKKTYPGLRRSTGMMTAFEFFHKGKAEAYNTRDGKTVYLAEIFSERKRTMAKEANKVKKSAATDKKSAEKKSNAGDKTLWVWALDFEDINELDRGFSVWSSQASAQARMEKEIRDLDKIFHGKIEREDDLHAVLDERFYWSIRKIKVYGDQDVDM